MAKKLLALAVAAIMLVCTLTVYADDEINYYEDVETVVAVGETVCPIDLTYEYAVFGFMPDDIGKYTISSDALVGIASYNGMWVTVDLNSETISANSIVWECTSVGQSILFAVKSNKATATVTVTYGEITIVEIPRTPYENKVTPTEFTFDGNPDLLQYVETFDDIENTAVLGEDGYYHLDSVDGPILYARLDDGMMSLADAYSYGQIVGIVYNEAGELIKKNDYNEAFNAYYTCSDDGIYPLTEDIIEFYKEVGRSNSWYGADGWVGGECDDAWMFACYYLPDLNGLGDVTSDGKIDEYDYILVARHHFGTRTLTDDEFPRADTNCDGEINEYDYILIARHIMGTYVIG
ncbi:MAG: dockerin type I repeat-containing protein [Clostridia bacterium]|nr:dockerin type I repeat-containing protein [Clostridia bacterium]